MNVINNATYSKTAFDTYKFRYKFEFDVLGTNYKSNQDVYSTETNKDVVYSVISQRTSEKVLNLELVHIASREQDDLDSQFIDELFNNLL